MKVLDSLLAGIVYAFVPSSLMLWHVTDAIFPFKGHQSPQTKQCKLLPSKRIVFDFKIARMCPTGSVAE